METQGKDDSPWRSWQERRGRSERLLVSAFLEKAERERETV